MKFGPIPVAEAIGTYLAHAVATPGGTLRKGTLLSAELVERIAATGAESVVAARIEPGDVHEDVAAGRLAAALAGPGVSVEAPATGRSNLHADGAGLLVLDPARIDAINRIDAAVTVATRLPLRAVEAGRMVATVKIIPFAVPEAVLERAITAAGTGAIAVEPFRPMRVAVVSTLLPSLKPSVVDKTLRVMAERIRPAGASVVADRRVSHEEGAVAAAIGEVAPAADLIVLFGASAVVDAGDVIPAAIERAGGAVVHLGMPVDPGNLLVLGDVDGKPVLGAPGCARSPRENGFDWVLERLLAGRRVSAEEIMGLGVGGLLMDIVSRPAPRSGEARREDPDAPRVAAVVLAAGRSSRFGANKLLAPFRGKPMIRHAAEAALASGASEVVVVTGHEAEAVAAALDGLPLRLVHNPAHLEGQSTSVRAGLAALDETAEAAVILLGDMPLVTGADVARIIGAYRPAAGAYVVVPTFEGRRGNPVLWSRRYFADLSAVEGDQGGRALIRENPEAVTTVELGPTAAFDVDTPETLASGTVPEDAQSAPRLSS